MDTPSDDARFVELTRLELDTVALLRVPVPVLTTFQVIELVPAGDAVLKMRLESSVEALKTTPPRFRARSKLYTAALAKAAESSSGVMIRAVDFMFRLVLWSW